MRKPLLAALAVALSLSFFAAESPARGSHGGGHHSTSSHHSSSGYSHSSHHSATHHAHSSASHSRKAAGVQRDSHGRIKRSARAKDAFKHSHPCPSTGRSSGACPGYVIDHVHALKHGGADDPSNMQWQTVEQAKEKDRWE